MCRPRGGAQQSCLLDCLEGKAAHGRKYAYVCDNKIEINHPRGLCGMCTPSDVCVSDSVSTTYFDRSPMRTGMLCYCIPGAPAALAELDLG